MKKYIWLILMILIVPNCVYASEIDAIDNINNYRLERENNLIESTNEVASTFITIPNEELKTETRFLNTNNIAQILLIIPIISSFIMYTIIIKTKEI